MTGTGGLEYVDMVMVQLVDTISTIYLSGNTIVDFRFKTDGTRCEKSEESCDRRRAGCLSIHVLSCS